MTPPQADELTTAQRALVAGAMPALRKMAKHLASRFPRFALDDLLQTVSLAASKAARTFDPERNVSFATYVEPRALGELIDLAAKDRRERAKLRAMQRALAEVMETITDAGDLLSETEQMRRARLDEFRYAVGGALFLSLLERQTPESEFLEAEERARVDAALREVLSALAPEVREVLEAHFVRGLPLTEVFRARGESYDAGRQRLVRTVYPRIGALLAARGIGPESLTSLRAGAPGTSPLGEKDQKTHPALSIPAASPR